MTKNRLLLVTILLIAALLRLTRLDMAEFKSDEAGIARQALAVVHDGQLPTVGPSSSQGPAHPPLQIYLLAVPFAITQDPRLAIAVVALIHTAAVGMAYALGTRFFDRRIGLIAAWLFAINPWAVYYARKMWTQNWPLATTLFISSLLLFFVERRPRALVGAFLALVALVGTHLGGIAFAVILFAVMLVFPWRVPRRPLLVGALVFLLFALPYLYHDATHDWHNLRELFNLSDGQVQSDLQAVRFAAWLTSGYHYQDLAGTSYRSFLDSLVNLGWLDLVEMLLLGMGVIYLLVKLRRLAWRAEAPRYVLLLLWLVIPVALQTRHSEPVYPHYFILLYPVQHLIVAILLIDGLDGLRARFAGRVLERGATAGLAAFLIALGGWQIYLGQAFVSFAAQHNTSGGYGPTLGPARRAASEAARAATGGAEVLVVARGDDPASQNMPAVLDALLPRDLPRRFVDGREALVFPQRPAVYLVAYQVEEAAATLQRQPDTELIAEIDVPGGRSSWVFRRNNANRDDVLAWMVRLDPPQRLANGVELLAFQSGDAPGADGILCFTLAWWLDGPPPNGIDYHTFAHLVSDDGQRWGGHDLRGFSATAWHEGDLVLTRFEIEIAAEPPPGDYWFNVGMYTWPEIVNVPLLDAAGNPTNDFAVIGPISLRRSSP